MKLKSFAIIAAATLLTSSCSLISPKGTTVKGSDGTQATTDTKNTSTNKTANPSQPNVTNNKSINGIDKNTSNKEDSKYEVNKTGNPTNQPMSYDTAEPADSRLNGEWTIIAVDGKNLPILDEMPYINFENATGRFYMSNTCNIINGDFKSVDNSKLHFSNTLSTMKYCPDIEFETAITAVVSTSEPIRYKIEKISQESYIEFLNAKGKVIMKARKHNMDFLNGNWQIERVGDRTVNDEEATIFIDISELKIHGNTGCNYFNGQIYINPEKANAIDFSNLASTRMACPKMDQESAILLALEQTVTAIQDKSGKAMLLDREGKELMMLKRTAISE